MLEVSLRELAYKNKREGKGGLKVRRRKGYDAERQLVKKLRKYGFKAVRVPVSAPSREPLPDVFATKSDTILAFEVKAQSSGRIYFRKSQVEKLFEFLSIFDIYNNKIAVLAGKFPNKWIFKKVEEPLNYTISKEEKNNINLRTT